MGSQRLAGTGTLLRFLLRLDRLKLTLWLVGLLFIIGITPSSLRAILETEAEAQGTTAEVVLAQQAALLQTNSATIALQGPPDALDTFGGRYAFEIGAFTLSFIALMNILLVGRHTRSEEESGRAELIRAAAVGPWATMAAVGILALLANLILGLGVSAVFAGDGLDAGRSLLYGSSITLCGLIFAAIALIWVQVFDYSRAATGASLAGVGVAFAIRAVGDVRGDWLSVLSPLGWVQSVNPFGDPVGWPYAVSVAAIALAVTTAIALAARRDVGAGLIAQRPGPAGASASLAAPIGFAWRLQKSTLTWWTIGIAFLGAVYGSVVSTIDDFVEENESMRDMLEGLGMSGDELRAGFITVILSMAALIATGGIIQTLLRPRTEETEGRAEPLLSTALSRRSWLTSHVVLAALAAPVFMAAAAMALTAADALVVGEITDPGGTLLAALARVPALWSVGGLGVLLYGLAHRLGYGVWVVFASVLVIFLFGDLLQLPDVVMNLSPLGHVTHLPGGDQSWPPIVALSLIGAVGAAAGVALFERRDLTTN
jgi:ABC-2 type transport system permease protein